MRLQVDERVEIGIVKDDGVGGGEVKPEAARARGDEEQEGVGARGVEVDDGALPVRGRHAPVDAAVHGRVRGLALLL